MSSLSLQSPLVAIPLFAAVTFMVVGSPIVYKFTDSKIGAPLKMPFITEWSQSMAILINTLHLYVYVPFSVNLIPGDFIVAFKFALKDLENKTRSTPTFFLMRCCRRWLWHPSQPPD
jgi:hypothetical protein